MRRGHLVVCAVGLKGSVFLDALLDQAVKVDRVYSYEQSDDLSNGFSAMRGCAERHAAQFDIARRPNFEPGDLVFLVGWQFLLPCQQDATLVVFHDSLLPRYRGFAPTVAALIAGEPEIGVTALSPRAGVDEGPIISQVGIKVSYPLKIAQALNLQATAMGELARKIVQDWKAGELKTVEQNHEAATYSLWRDERDYFIDWSRPAEEIARFVDATGYPYAGARTRLDSNIIIIDEATSLPDLEFVHRIPGKVWSLVDNKPVVVCGTGLLRLDSCRGPDGSATSFTRLRTRLE